MIRAAALSALSTGSRALALLALTKLAAATGGPNAVLVFANCQSFFAALAQLVTGGTMQGVVRGVAERRDDPGRRVRMVGTAATVALACSVFLSVTLILARVPLAEAIFFSVDYTWLVCTISAGLLLTAAYQFALAIANGEARFGRFAAISIGADVSALLITWIGWPRLDWEALLVGYVLGQAGAGLISGLIWIAIMRRREIAPYIAFSRDDARELATYTTITLAALLLTPLIQILVRNGLLDFVGPVRAGLWQVLWFVSDAVVGMSSGTLAPVLLPHLARCPDGAPLRRSVLRIYRWLAPATLVVALLLWAARKPLVGLMFADAFLPAAEQMGILVVAMSIRMMAWPLAFLLIVRARAKTFVIGELVFGAAFLASSAPFAVRWGLSGIALAYGMSYLIYFVFVLSRTSTFLRAAT